MQKKMYLNIYGDHLKVYSACTFWDPSTGFQMELCFSRNDTKITFAPAIGSLQPKPRLPAAGVPASSCALQLLPSEIAPYLLYWSGEVLLETGLGAVLSPQTSVFSKFWRGSRNLGNVHRKFQVFLVFSQKLCNVHCKCGHLQSMWDK